MSVGGYAVVIGCAACAGLHAALSRRIAAVAWIAFGQFLYGRQWTRDAFIRRYAFWSVAVGAVIVLVAVVAIASQ